MNDKMFYGQKVFAIIMMVLFSHLCIFADENVRSHFEYDYQGVVYKVNFNKREAYAWSVSTTNPVTVVKIKSFSLKGSKIKEMTTCRQCFHLVFIRLLSRFSCGKERGRTCRHYIVFPEVLRIPVSDSYIINYNAYIPRFVRVFAHFC